MIKRSLETPGALIIVGVESGVVGTVDLDGRAVFPEADEPLAYALSIVDRLRLKSVRVGVSEELASLGDPVCQTCGRCKAEHQVQNS